MQNLVERFLAAEGRFTDRVAVIVQGEKQLEEFTYAELRHLAETAAASLRVAGIAPGDRCALLADNHARWCAAFLGILGVGGVAVPFDTTLKPAEIATLLRDAGCRAIFASKNYLPAVRAAAESCPNLRHTLVLDALAPASGGTGVSPVSLPACPGRRDDLAAILYTSGTTSDPKGVMLTHSNLLAEIDAVLQVITVNPDDCVLGVLPLFHALPLLANFWLPFSVGASAVFLQSISSGEILRAMRERGVSIFCVVPQFFYLIHSRITDQVEAAGWLRRRLFRLLLAANGAARSLGVNFGRLLFRPVHTVFGPRMRLLVTGGSRFDATIGRDFHRLGFTLLQAYGLTECAGAATITPAHDNRIGSVGRPLPGVEVKLLPAELPLQGVGGNPVEELGDSGEIAIRGPIVMTGYYNRPDASAAVLQGGWLRTGDLGYFDPDGHLFITGRKKDVIVLSSGKNIYPEEIEAHYAQSPYIKELCVLGRTPPAGRVEPLAERLHAVVVPNFDVLRERKMVNAREIIRFEIESLSLQLPAHKRILSYEVWPHELPRTTTRKLKRFEIERALAAGAAEAGAEAGGAGREITAADRVWLAQPRVARACTLIARAAGSRSSGTGDLHPDANLELDLGLDSMQRVELLVALEQEFGVELDEQVTSGIYTARELVEALLGASRAGGQPRAPQRLAWEALLTPAAEHDSMFSDILKPKPVLAPLLYAATRLLYAVARVLLRLRVKGREHLPCGRPYILSPNHQSYLDAFLLVSALPYQSFRRLFFVGASEYFATPLMRWLAKSINLIPVDPDINLVRSMQAGAFGLRHGKVLVLFPEGERSIDGELKTFKKGAAILSTHLQVPIVPVALHGLYDVWPRGAPPRRLAPVRIRIGPGLPPPAPPTSQSEAREIERGYERLTATLRDRVVEMFEALRPWPSA